MTIMERVTADTVTAMKAKDQPRVEALRLLKSELKKKEIDKKVKALLAASKTPFLDLEALPRSRWPDLALQGVLEHPGLRQRRL